MVAGAYIRAGQDAEVKFYMPLLMNGIVYLKVRTADYEYLKSYVVAIEAPADPTSVTTISADDSDISDAPYYDLQGHDSSHPFKGMNIVLKQYRDGSKQTTKQIF